MIHARVKMELEQKKKDDALQILRSIAKRTRSKTGCISCSIYQSIEDTSLIMFEQFWSSDDAMLRYLRSSDYKKLLLIIEMAMTEPEIRFNTVVHSTGVATIEKARMSKRIGDL